MAAYRNWPARLVLHKAQQQEPKNTRANLARAEKEKWKEKFLKYHQRQ